MASIYKEEEKLEASAQGMENVELYDGGGTHYKNVKDKQYSNDKEYMGKEFD
jgi:hypothetical protein